MLEQTFNIKLAQELGLHASIMVAILTQLKSTHSVELGGVNYVGITFEVLQEVAPYLTKEEANLCVQSLVKGNYVKLYKPEQQTLFLLTDKLHKLLAECTPKKKRAAATKRDKIDIPSIVATYGFSEEDAEAVIKWCEFRAVTYGLKRTEQAIKVQCSNLVAVNEAGFDVVGVIDYVMGNTEWQNIRLEVVQKLELDRQSLAVREQRLAAR